MDTLTLPEGFNPTTYNLYENAFFFSVGNTDEMPQDTLVKGNMNHISYGLFIQMLRHPQIAILLCSAVAAYDACIKKQTNG